MHELTTSSIRAELFPVELFASFCHIVGGQVSLLDQLVFAVGVRALVAPLAGMVLLPALAHLRLLFSFELLNKFLPDRLHTIFRRSSYISRGIRGGFVTIVTRSQARACFKGHRDGQGVVGGGRKVSKSSRGLGVHLVQGCGCREEHRGLFNSTQLRLFSIPCLSSLESALEGRHEYLLGGELRHIV